jgi:anionic cell wall polymer biosynthesis LytR-Cps2A-Psr (LCP) family protein
MEREEYVVLDTVTGTCDTVHFLFFFNNHMFSTDKTATVGPTLQAELVPFPLNLLAVLFAGVDDRGRATYNALQKVPEADTIVPLTVETKAAGLNPLFWTTSATVKGKAVKIKSDSEL